MASLALVGVLPVLAAPASAVLPACTVSWANQVDGAWDVAANWSTGAVPGASDDVCIEGSSPYRVAMTGSVAIRSIVLGSGNAQQRLVANGTAASSAHITLATASTVRANAVLELDANAGVAVVDGPGSLTNSGTIWTTGVTGGFRILGLDVMNTVGGTVEVDGLPTVLGAVGTTTTNNGTITVTANGGLFFVDSTFVSNPGSTLDLLHGGNATAVRSTFRQAGGKVDGVALLRNGSTLDDSAGSIANFRLEPVGDPSTIRGTVPQGQVISIAGNVDGDVSAILAGPSVVNDGFIQLTSTVAGRSATLAGAPITNNGFLVVKADAGGPRYLRTPVTNNGQLLFGATTLMDNATTIVNNGLMGLEDDVDLLFTGGSFTNSAGGTLYATVNAATRAASLLGGSATAYLAGTLEVRTIGSPAAGSTYTPITVSSRLGTFSAVTSAAPSVTPYTATYSSTSVGLVVGPPRARFVPVTPGRILDTRIGIGATAGRRGPNGVISLPVAGRGGVPATGASAVVLTVTGVDSSPGFVTVWPTGTTRPTASNLNTTRAGQTSAVQVVVPVGSDGTVSLYTSGGGHLLADVAGWYETVGRATSGRFGALAPTRLLDTRNGTGAAAGRRGAGATVTVPVAGLGGVPASGASSVVLSVTSVDSSPGFVTVWPAGQARPTASNLNADFSGQVVAAHVVVPVGAGGSVSLFTSGGGHLLVDVVGWFTDGAATESTSGLYVALSPLRRLDTRTGLGVSAAGTRPSHSTTGLLLGGSGGIPSTGVSAVVANLTAVQAAPTFLTAWAGGAPRPLASNLNVSIPGDIVPNLVTSPVGGGAFLNVYTDGASHLLLDTAGYYQA